MLNVTKANVCAIMDVARSFFASASGISTQERSSCGRKARDSVCSEAEDAAEAAAEEDAAAAELMYSRTL